VRLAAHRRAHGLFAVPVAVALHRSASTLTFPFAWTYALKVATTSRAVPVMRMTSVVESL
jgi:hypothetical protein